jgi:FkbM family methyltransferase
VTPAITLSDGWYWPMSDEHARPVIERDCLPSIAALLKHIPDPGVIVQAGANVGLYPLALADHFHCVFTFEPDPTNYDCLRLNLKARDGLRRVVAQHAALGEMAGFCTPLEVEPRNCGAHRVNFAKGPIPVVTVDSLGLERCECIWLDIEGAELAALKGATTTIERFSPIIAVEDKGLHRAFDILDGALQAWLAERRYEEIDRIGNDKVFRRA